MKDLACSAVSASHSASGAFVRNFAEGRVWSGGGSPSGEVRGHWGEGGWGGGVRRQRNEDEGVSWPAVTAEGCDGRGPAGADLRKAAQGPSSSPPVFSSHSPHSLPVCGY